MVIEAGEVVLIEVGVGGGGEVFACGQGKSISICYEIINRIVGGVEGSRCCKVELNIMSYTILF